MNKYLLFNSANFISVSMIYYVSNDLYSNHVKQTKKYISPVDEYRYLLNKKIQ